LPDITLKKRRRILKYFEWRKDYSFCPIIVLFVTGLCATAAYSFKRTVERTLSKAVKSIKIDWRIKELQGIFINYLKMV
jgi:hypothetical protein